MIKQGEKYLVTTDEWFIAPDGNSYCAVWGNVILQSDSETLGIKTNDKSTNWYAIVGTHENHVVIAGCQLHYAVKCKDRPSDSGGTGWASDAQNGIKVYNVPNKIYYTE